MVDEVLALTFQGGKRLQRTIVATAGNVVINESPATGKRWLIVRGQFYFDTDGTAANRYIRIEITDGTNIIERLGRTDAIIANQTAWITLGEVRANLGVDTFTIGVDDSGDKKYYIGIDPILIEEADQFRITVGGGVAGDSMTGYLVVMEL